MKRAQLQGNLISYSASSVLSSLVAVATRQPGLAPSQRSWFEEMSSTGATEGIQVAGEENSRRVLL